MIEEKERERKRGEGARKLIKRERKREKGESQRGIEKEIQPERVRKRKKIPKKVVNIESGKRGIRKTKNAKIKRELRATKKRTENNGIRRQKEHRKQ